MATRVTNEIAQAVRYLQAGAVVAYPTEAVWGLGCDPANAASVQRIMALKGRPGEKGMILIAAEVDQVRPWLAAPEELDVAMPHWPGPVTFVMSAGNAAPSEVCRPDGSLAVRVTDHPLCRALCAGFGGALVSTSANPAGQPPALTSDAVMDYFPGRLDLVLRGDTGARTGPSEIRDARSGEILRSGS